MIIHKLLKERQGQASVIRKSQLHQLTPAVEKLVQVIHALYSERTSKGYGRFEADKINYPSSRILREAFKDNTKTFLEASQDLMTVLAAKAGQLRSRPAGYVLMAHITNDTGVSWFLVAMITNAE